MVLKKEKLAISWLIARLRNYFSRRRAEQKIYKDMFVSIIQRKNANRPQFKALSGIILFTMI